MIRQRCEEMIQYAYVTIRHFPKFERHVLGAEIRETVWKLLRMIIICNKRYHKKTTLTDLDAELDVLRSQVRTAFSLQYIDLKKYEHWARMNDELGRMIGGWMKSQQG
nr:diversity-generating retroelement protein Avd [Stutzerimonas stutzeri]